MAEHSQRAAGSQWGQSLVEFALILPVLLLILMGIFDMGIAVWQYNTISNVARESARYAVVRTHQPLTQADFADGESNPRSNAAAVAAGRNQAHGLRSDSLEIHVYPESDWEQRNIWGMVLTATVAYTYSPLTAIVPKGLIVLRANSVMITE